MQISSHLFDINYSQQLFQDISTSSVGTNGLSGQQREKGFIDINELLLLCDCGSDGSDGSDGCDGPVCLFRLQTDMNVI